MDMLTMSKMLITLDKISKVQPVQNELGMTDNHRFLVTMNADLWADALILVNHVNISSYQFIPSFNRLLMTFHEGNVKLYICNSFHSDVYTCTSEKRPPKASTELKSSSQLSLIFKQSMASSRTSFISVSVGSQCVCLISSNKGTVWTDAAESPWGDLR